MNLVKSGVNLTILIPILNDEENALITIRSIRSQFIKIIIIDGSNINNKVIFENEKNVVYVQLEGSTIYEAMQEGVRMAETEFVFFAGAGDLIEEINYYNNCDITIGFFRIDNGPLRDGYMCRKFWRNPMHHQATVYRKSCIKFDLSLKILSDFDMNIRLIKNGNKVGRVKSTFAKIKPHGTSNNILIAITEGLRVYQSNRIFMWYPIYLIVLLLSRIRNQFKWE
jgi:glycosyltransferase involved in cell wall biosynthesis